MSTMLSRLPSCQRPAAAATVSARPRCTLSIHASDTLARWPGVISGISAWSSIGMSFCPSVATSTHRPGQGTSWPTLSRSVSRIDIWSYRAIRPG